METRVISNALLAAAFAFVFAGPGTAMAGECPAFTVSMVDAAAMAFGLYRGEVTSIDVDDDPKLPGILCEMEGSIAPNRFRIDVNWNYPDSAWVSGQHAMEDSRDYDTNLYSIADNLSPQELKACRDEILKSFVWVNYCAPALQ